MEAEVTYIAKDGCRFTDPIQCEEYEKTIGVLKNSVADVILELDKHNENDYISGVVLVRHRKDGSGHVYTRFTGCVDSMLESFVNISNLTGEQRYMTSTFGELKDELREHDKDDWVQYMIVYSSSMDFEHPGIMANYNPMVWKDNASNGK
jgi:hypothetical protein